MPLPIALLDRLAAVLGPHGLLTDPSDLGPYLAEQRGLFQGTAQAVARPLDTAQVAQVVGLCAEAGVAIVPQGGNTGLVGGGVASGDDLVVSLGRMNRLRWIDAENYRIAVDAGCVLAEVQRAAREAGCLFPLSLAAEGSCQIGGNLSSNAGGVGVLRYGNARELCLGLEVVLADGRVWNGMTALAKDNTGYALRQMFIGAEGTLGIITGAVLKLFPAPRESATALCALSDLGAAPRLLSLARKRSGDSVTAFELIPRLGLEMAVRHMPGCRDPLADPAPWYALIELSSSREAGDNDESGLGATLEGLLAGAFDEGIISDAVLAGSLEQQAALWRLREGLSEAQKFEGASIKHDVSVPISRVVEFITEASAAVERALPGIRPCPFGHIGDGNIHFNLTQPPGMDRAAFLALWAPMNRIVHDIVDAMEGSISAEHGIGQLKTAELARYKAPVELEMMRAIKAAFDPRNLMNPGKVLPPAP
ncbi:FAD-binding oxidoreductase [Rhodospirillum rubrum]|uniref:FAD linked oxidase-like n=1 Tax=Rhodospirillum rubrum (strain ATCC 11170 / ATH 1.1.1 / DSM 467 / LMG 4362 / NCIMB 8255 / S1) TaxID=269796 RepID=Q2RX98_RHORT|nr:FAD-binding oxidoreductase [Rhodospirillum rubrum]ABC21247.1 FAD linked oxidase-like [Rhodospirillum rubrum ATCC 11170]AEO46922.1 FAD linked oxidase-like protein [Rhodospirillum rubrum F11]MBK5952800.1 FAD-binding oxidoreductase [Rhodospirillum rubrum]QXG80932.1 FAD-binding oxidoreductase [Rhodospirillum rubrum]HAQ00788.1 FAD-binding oxidoreductase [Rhodospirillum rubrum]